MSLMAPSFVACDREQSFLMPPDVREWLPPRHLAWFVIDAVAEMDLESFYASAARLSRLLAAELTCGVSWDVHEAASLAIAPRSMESLRCAHPSRAGRLSVSRADTPSRSSLWRSISALSSAPNSRATFVSHIQNTSTIAPANAP